MVKSFFLNFNDCFFKFKIFNLIHVISLVGVFVVLMLILYNRKKLLDLDFNKKKKIRILFGCILLIFYILRRGSFLYYGVYNWKYHLDLGFCNMTNLLFIIYCFSGNKKLYNICYYCAFSGPLLSVLFPSVNISVNNFSFFNFIVIHHGVFLMNIVLAMLEKKSYNKIDFIIAYIFMLGYIILCYIFNWYMQTNYNHLNQFIVGEIQHNNIVLKLISNIPFNILFLIIVNVFMVMFANYILNLLNEGVCRNEKKVS